jgi:hypothetical protein
LSLETVGRTARLASSINLHGNQDIDSALRQQAGRGGGTGSFDFAATKHTISLREIGSA